MGQGLEIEVHHDMSNEWIVWCWEANLTWPVSCSNRSKEWSISVDVLNQFRQQFSLFLVETNPWDDYIVIPRDLIGIRTTIVG